MASCVLCTQPFVLQLTCGCRDYCQECTFQSLKAKLKGHCSALATTVGCWQGHELSLEEIYHIAKGSEEEDEILTLILLSSLRGNKEVFYCPAEGCGYVGWHDSVPPCQAPLECGKCGLQWSESVTLPAWHHSLQFCKKAFLCDHSWTQVIFTEVYVRNCPSCDSPNVPSSTDPLTCSRCKLTVCRLCYTPMNRHVFDVCLLRACTFRSLILLLAVLLSLKCFAIVGHLHQVLVYCATALCAFTAIIVFLGLFACITLRSLVLHEDPDDYEEVSPIRGYVALGSFTLLHVLYSACTDWGRRVWAVEGAVWLAALHCALGFAYLHYAR